MRGYAHFGYVAGSLPETEAAASEIFSLPLYPSLTDAEQDRVCEALHAICSTLEVPRG
jgi:aminotransferase EvaB